MGVCEGGREAAEGGCCECARRAEEKQEKGDNERGEGPLRGRGGRRREAVAEGGGAP